MARTKRVSASLAYVVNKACAADSVGKRFKMTKKMRKQLGVSKVDAKGYEDTGMLPVHYGLHDVAEIVSPDSLKL